MSSKQMVNASEGICFRLANVVSLHQLNEERRVMSEEFNRLLKKGKSKLENSTSAESR